MDVSALPAKSVFLLQQEHCMTGHAVSAWNLRHKEQVSSLAASSLYTLVQLANSKFGFTFMPELAIQNHILSSTQLISLRRPSAGTAGGARHKGGAAQSHQE